MQKKRIEYMDAIKVFLTCLVVAHHAGQPYGPTGGMWPVKDSGSAPWLGDFFFINAAYMMGLYFFISGYFMVFSLTRKSTATFIKDRLTRLGIPLLFFTFFLFLPFNYLGSDQRQPLLSFFLDSYLHNPPAATGHLWFVASLLAYTFIYLLLFSGRQAEQKPAPAGFRVQYIFIYVLLLALLAALVRRVYHIDEWRTWIIPVEPAHLPQYLSLFLAGALFNRYQWLESLKLSTGLLFLALGILAYVLSSAQPEAGQSLWWVESVVESFLCVGISLFLLTAFRTYGNRSNRVIRALSDNAYGIYLFHVFVVIGLQKALLPWAIPVNLKLLIVTVLGIVLSMGISALARQSKLLRRII